MIDRSNTAIIHSASFVGRKRESVPEYTGVA
jgi:hypothetical protein